MYIQKTSTMSDWYRITKTPYMIPENPQIINRGKVDANQPFVGLSPQSLPTYNHYEGADGGYVLIFTRNKEKAVYGVGGNVYAMGRVRIQGKYEGRVLVPPGYQLGDNITQDPDILAICEKYFPDMKGQMWVGGDTGGWFGLAGYPGRTPDIVTNFPSRPFPRRDKCSCPCSKENAERLHPSYDVVGGYVYDSEGYPVRDDNGNHKRWERD